MKLYITLILNKIPQEDIAPACVVLVLHTDDIPNFSSPISKVGC